MNFYLVEIYVAAMNELGRTKEEEDRRARSVRLEQLWKSMKQAERSLAEVAIGIRR